MLGGALASLTHFSPNYRGTSTAELEHGEPSPCFSALEDGVRILHPANPFRQQSPLLIAPLDISHPASYKLQSARW